MILVSAPLRISLFGGGSDIPTYYSKYGGAFLSFSIESRLYIALNPTQNNELKVHYSRTEVVTETNHIQHDLIREAFLLNGIENNVEVCSFADIPTSGTGLGSSSTFSVALLGALSLLKKRPYSARELAEGACHLEIDRCGSPIGKQDQYAAAFGGLNFYEIERSGYIKVHKNIVDRQTEHELMSRLFLVYTGVKRDANYILKEQITNVGGIDSSIVAQDSIVEMAYQNYQYLKKKELDQIGLSLNSAWEMKKKLASRISNIHLDQLYGEGIAAGALGGKLLGAGGGGFFLFYVPPSRKDKFCKKFIGRFSPVNLSQQGFVEHYVS